MSKSKKKSSNKRYRWKRKWNLWKKRMKNRILKALKASAVLLVLAGLVLLLTGGKSFSFETKGEGFPSYIVDKTIDRISSEWDEVTDSLKDQWNQIKTVVKRLEHELSGEDGKQVISIEEIPPYEGEPYIILEDNIPSFTKEEICEESYEYYSELDYLGRCGVTMACIGKDIMPTEERGPIGMVRPSGWQLIKYDIVDGKYLYNRCHLIGFQLTGENANVNNLITGTRAMNVDGMLPFENEVADYVKETGNHVMYRVTPVFEGNNLVASGVIMEALSVEDKGAGVQFHVYVYNNQPGVEINYQNGESRLISD